MASADNASTILGALLKSSCESAHDSLIVPSNSFVQTSSTGRRDAAWLPHDLRSFARQSLYSRSSF